MAIIPPENGARKTGDDEGKKRKKPTGVVDERTGEGDSITEDDDGEDEEEECGPECRNLLHELGHPQEEARCPGAGQVIDIWGYCRSVLYSTHCRSVNTDIVTLYRTGVCFTKRLHSLTRDS